MPRRAKRAPTIVDIARKLKLSAMTVSRALNGNPEVSKKTRERVIRTAEALGYQANRWARSLVTSRSLMIGVVIPDIAHSFFAEVTFGIEEAAEKFGYDILLCHTRSNPDRERTEISMLVGSRVDGLIVASVESAKSTDALERLRESKVPVVLVDRFFPKLPISCVRVDDRRAGRIATEHLVSLGHRRVAHIAGPPITPADLRRRGYMDALGALGIEVRKEWMPAADFELPGGRDAMRRLLSLDERPTAVFASNDPMALGALYACREAGLNVPEDISVVGAGNIEGLHHPNPFLTTIDWPRVELGRRAAEMLIEMIQSTDGEPEPQDIVLEPQLLVRQSTARPRAGA